MAITRIQQSQISGSLSLSDNVSNADLVKSSRTLADDLNSLRTQVKNIMGTSAWTDGLDGSQDLADIYAAMHASGMNAAFQGDVSMAGNADLNGTLDVAGASDLHGDVHAYGALDVDGNAEIGEPSTLQAQLLSQAHFTLTEQQMSTETSTLQEHLTFTAMFALTATHVLMETQTSTAN